MKILLSLFTPNNWSISRKAMLILAVGQLSFIILHWSVFSSPVIPKPIDLLPAFHDLWFEDGLGQELITSFLFSLQAILMATALSLGLAYLTVMPFFRPVVGGFSKGRFLGMSGLSYFFMLFINGQHNIKLSMVVFAISVFFVTGMVDIVSNVSQEKKDYGRTLRMSEWHVVWEVIILGTMDQAIELMRQNAAIGWMMLFMVEPLFRVEGGIGVLLTNQDKHLVLAKVIDIEICVLIVGVIMDFGFGLLKVLLCPHTAVSVQGRK